MLSSEGLGVHISSFGSSHSSKLTMTHNNFFQVLFGMGFFGLISSILIFVNFFYEIKRINSLSLKHFYTLSFWALCFFGFVEFGVFGPTNILILVFSILIYSLHKYDRPKID